MKKTLLTSLLIIFVLSGIVLINRVFGAATSPRSGAQAIWHDIFSGQTGTGWGAALKLDQFDFYGLQIATNGNADATIKCYGSKSSVEPVWGTASITNRYSGKYMTNESSGGNVQGDTGVVLSGTDIINEYHINTDKIRWFNCNIPTYSTGSLFTTIVGRLPMK